MSETKLEAYLWDNLEGLLVRDEVPQASEAAERCVVP
jgi:hypothetical protein